MKYVYIIAILLIVGLAACSQTTTTPGTNSVSTGEETNMKLSDGDLTVELGEFVNDEMSGPLNIDIQTVPADTDQILIFLKPKNMPPSDNPFNAPNTIVKFVPGQITHETFDTLTVENGEYELSVGAVPVSGASGWTAEIKAEFTISN